MFYSYSVATLSIPGEINKLMQLLIFPLKSFMFSSVLYCEMFMHQTIIDFFLNVLK